MSTTTSSNNDTNVNDMNYPSMFQHWTRVKVKYGVNKSNENNNSSNNSNTTGSTNDDDADADADTNNTAQLLVSNRTVHQIQWNINHIQMKWNFISKMDMISLRDEIFDTPSPPPTITSTTTTGSASSHYYEGFDGPRRLIRYYDVRDCTSSCSSSTMATTNTTTTVPNILLQLKQRLWQETGFETKYIKIEEYIPLIVHSPSTATTTTTTTTTTTNNSSNNNNNNNSTTIWRYDPNMISTFPYNNNYRNNNTNPNETYFIAEIPIPVELDVNDDESILPLIQNWNQPILPNTETNTKEGLLSPSQMTAIVPSVMRWRLQSEHHTSFIHVPYKSILLRTSSTSTTDQNNNDDLLTKWRNSRYMYADSNNTTTTSRRNGKKPIRVIQFYNFDTKSNNNNNRTVMNDSNECSNSTTTTTGINNNNNYISSSNCDTFGYVSTNINEVTERTRRLQLENSHTTTSTTNRNNYIHKISDLVTIVITTSPIKSHPSTDVIQQCMNTFVIGGGPSFAYECQKIIVCDGYRTKAMKAVPSTQHQSEEEDMDNETDDVVDNNDNDDVVKNDDLPLNNSDTDPGSKNSNVAGRVSNRHCNDKQSMRNGIVTEQQAHNYCQYKQNLHQLCRDSANNVGSVFYNTQIIELSTRHGYGYAVRHVLRDEQKYTIKTPYVCIVQHDRTFMRPTPILETLRAMWYHSNIKYVGFSMRSNLMYRDIYIAKYGKGSSNNNTNNTEYDDMILYVPQLQVDSSQYGPNSASTNALSVNNERVKQNIHALCESYRGSAQAMIERKIVDTPSDRSLQTNSIDSSNTNIVSTGGKSFAIVPPIMEHTTTTSRTNDHQMSLVPTLFWYDNVHICETQHYRDFIFHPSYKMVSKGGFIEDKLSPILKRTVERLGLQDGHSRFGCYLLDDHSGMFFTGHIDGGSYISPEERKELLASQQQQKRDAM